MAFQFSQFHCKGIVLQNAYVRISHVSYNHREKAACYVLSAYANKSMSDVEGDEETRLGDVFVGVVPLELGEAVPDMLAQIYEDIKKKAWTEPQEPQDENQKQPFSREEPINPIDPLRDASKFKYALDI